MKLNFESLILKLNNNLGWLLLTTGDICKQFAKCNSVSLINHFSIKVLFFLLLIEFLHGMSSCVSLNPKLLSLLLYNGWGTRCVSNELLCLLFKMQCCLINLVI